LNAYSELTGGFEVDFIVGHGDGLKAQYFNGTADSYGLKAQPVASPSYGYGLQSLSKNSLALNRIDSTINFNWKNGSPASSVHSDNFSAEWTGQVLAPETGTYTFTTKSDDGIAVWVNGQQLINSWNDHSVQQNSGKINLQAGQKYDIKVDYYEHGGSAVAQLYWSAPDITQQIIPKSYLYSSVTMDPQPTAPSPVVVPAPVPVAATGNGLKGQYFNSTNLDPNSLALTRTDASVNFDWSNSAPDSKLNPDNFSAEWTGQILAPQTGTYTFSTKSDDGVRVWVNGQQLINSWNDHGAQLDSGTISLQAGQKYDIKVDYYERSGAAVMQLYWSAPDIAQQIVPQAYLSSSVVAEPAPVIPSAPSPVVVPPASSPVPVPSPSSTLSPAFTDSSLPNEGAPSGVPSYYDWAQGPTGGYGNNIPSGWNAFTAWGQLYVAQGWNPPANSNTRVQITNLDSWYLSKSTGKWIQIQHASVVDGAAFVEDFANNASKPADVKDESKNGGGVSVTAGNGYNYHFWTDRTVIQDPNDIGGIYTRFQARLVLNDPNGLDDRSSARYIANDGADYWRSMDAGWSADWSTNGGVGGGRFKFVTADWQNFSMETLTPEQLLKNPPPVA
jgi:PA14 domain